MRKYIFTILLLNFIQIITLGQSNVTSIIKGLVVEQDDTPVMYASIALVYNEKIVTGTMTDTTGFFQIKGQFSGNYIVRTSFIGYNSVEKNIECNGEQVVNIGKIILDKNTILLNEVTVTSEAASKNVAIEKTSINPNANINSTTGSVVELLKSSASVTIDGDNNILIRGNNNVLILIDGVPTTLGSLESLSTANIQSIDVFTSPDVKYDSEGTGGIINIVSKKPTSEAFNAMASFNYGFNDMLNGNLSMSYNKKKWKLRFNYNGKYENDIIESELFRIFIQSGDGIDQIIRANKKTSNQAMGLNVMFTATPKNVFTFDLKALFPRLNNFQDFNNNYLTDGQNSKLFRQTDITFNREIVESSLNYKHIFVPQKEELRIIGSVSKTTGHRPSFYYEEGQMVQKSESGGRPLVVALQADYSLKTRKGLFDSGIKMTVRNNDIDHKFYEFDTITQTWDYSEKFSNDLIHTEYIPAAYAMFSSKLTESVSYKIGARMEYSHVRLKSDKENLSETNDDWFFSPNIILNYKVSEPWSLSFELSRRVSRPTYPQLNPYVNLIDNQTYETGNIHLSPEKANKIDLGYSYFSNTFVVNGNAYFNFTQDYITQIATLVPDGLMTTYINGDTDIKAGIDHNIRLNLLRWMSMDLAANIFYNVASGKFNEVEFTNEGCVNSDNASINVKPINGMNVQFQYFLVTPQYFPQFTTKTIHYANIGVRQSFLKNTLSISLVFNDVFNTRRWDISSDNAVFSLINNSKNHSQMLWLGVTFNFNSYKPLKDKQKQEEDRSIIRIGG